MVGFNYIRESIVGWYSHIMINECALSTVGSTHLRESKSNLIVELLTKKEVISWGG